MRTREELQKMFDELGKEFDKHKDNEITSANVLKLNMIVSKRNALLWAMGSKINLTTK